MTFSSRTEMYNHWLNYGRQHLEGRTIVRVSWLDEDEVEALGWNTGTIVMELDDGTLLYPSRDDEGNGPGALFGNSSTGELTFPVMRPLPAGFNSKRLTEVM